MWRVRDRSGWQQRDPQKDMLVEVFCDGALAREHSFEEIHERADIPLGPWIWKQPA